MKQGLNSAEVMASRQKYGENVLTPPKHESIWKLYAEKYRDPIIQILLVAAAISLVLAFVEHDFIETIGIFVAIFLATTIGFYFEVDASRKFRVLAQVNDNQKVKVRRDGKVTLVPRHELVVGDVIVLEVGDEVPADAELFASRNLQIDESSLTGEQLTDKKERTPDDGEAVTHKADEAYPKWMVLRSSMVMSGRGEAVVTAVGDNTEIGKVARKSTENAHVKTPLNMQLEKLANLISKVGTIVAVAAFVIFLVHDILTSPLWHGRDYFAMLQVVLNYFMMSVTLIVMAVPEGLPMAVTLALALNMRRMLKSNNLVRKLHACETMGAVNVICTDKTGTLTQNKMTVGEMRSFVSKEDGASTAENVIGADPLLPVAIAVNTTAELDADKGIGNPTEVAMLMWLKGQGADYAALRQSITITDQIPFSTENKYMLTTAIMDGRKYHFLKGAPEIVMGRCSMTDRQRAEAQQQLMGYQSHAMRTLALAYCPDGEEKYSLQALVAISDPLREDVPAAVQQCQEAGIEVKIVTGDTSATAEEIGREIGIIQNSNSITGPEFAALSDEDAYKVAEEIRVMSRARPTDKQRLVTMLQKHGHVVAVTGDGTNDAPALNYAHVGLSLGSGTSVAKQASDMTLLDDSFGSIAKAVMWGRSLYKNIQRFLFFQLVVNVAALLLVLGGSVIGTEMPLTVTQILWVNLIMDTFAAMALASLPPSREVMRDKPRRPTDFIITRPMGRSILATGIAMFVGMFVFLIYCERRGVGGVDIHELTWFFTTFVMLQFWNLLNAKCLGSVHSAFRRLWADKGLLLVMLLILIGQIVIVTIGGRMFRTVPLSITEWLVIIAATSIVLWIGEAIRAIERARIHA